MIRCKRCKYWRDIKPGATVVEAYNKDTGEKQWGVCTCREQRQILDASFPNLAYHHRYITELNNYCPCGEEISG